MAQAAPENRTPVLSRALALQEDVVSVLLVVSICSFVTCIDVEYASLAHRQPR